MEYQVVVMAAGKASRMTEITSTRPKCLLPVANQPLVYYPLKSLELAGFNEIMVIVLDTVKGEVESALGKTDLAASLNFITIPSETDWGTADTLRHISPLISTDFIVVSCDLITTTNVIDLLNLHREHDSSITCFFFQESLEKDTVIPGLKSSNIKPDKYFAGIDVESNRLIFTASASDYDRVVRMGVTMLEKFPRFHLFSHVLDSHFYIMKRWLLKFLSVKTKISTVKGELLPLVARRQSSKKNTGIPRVPPNSVLSDEALEDGISAHDYPADGKCVECFGHRLDENHFAVRVNTVRDYVRANKMIPSIWKGNLDKISPEADVNSNQFEKESCCVAAGTKISPKTSVKGSNLGRNCVIRPKTRITNCVLMDNVVIREGCVLENCVICDDVIVEENCVIKDCLIGSQHKVEANGNHSREVLTEMDELIEI